MQATSRDRIVAGAARAVAAHGVRDTVVAHLLDEAGVSRRTFYKHFRSAEDALAALYDEATEALDRRVAEATERAPDPLRMVLDALDAYLDYVRERDPLLVQLHAEAATPGSLLGPARQRTLDALVDRIDAGVREHLGVPVDPLVWRGLLLAVEGLVIEAGQPFDEAAHARVRRVVRPIFVSVLASTPHLPRS